MTRLLYDSTTPERSIPANAAMILAYIDGAQTSGNMAAAKASHPKAFFVPCTVVGTPGAKVGDCETGDMTVPGVVRWADGEVRAGRHPTIYCNFSTWPDVEREVAVAGLQPIRDLHYGIADYDNNPTIPPDWVARGCIFKQYRSDTNQNLDYSVVADYWPGVDPPAPKEDDMAIAITEDAAGNIHVAGVTPQGHPLLFTRSTNGAVSVTDLTDAVAAANPNDHTSYTVQP